jgi:hypothetical protein
VDFRRSPVRVKYQSTTSFWRVHQASIETAPLTVDRTALICSKSLIWTYHYRKICLFRASTLGREQTHGKESFAVSRHDQRTAKSMLTAYLQRTHGTLWLTAMVSSRPTAKRSTRRTAQIAHGKSLAHGKDHEKLTANCTARQTAERGPHQRHV